MASTLFVLASKTDLSAIYPVINDKQSLRSVQLLFPFKSNCEALLGWA